jgi:deoxyribonuclease IV
MSMNERVIGCHVSCAGGLIEAVKRGGALKVPAIQVHPCAPQRWNTHPYPAISLDSLNSERRAHGISHIFFHGIYLINLANPDPRKRHLARQSLLHDLEYCHRIGGQGVVFHVGSMKDEPDYEIGLQRCADEVRAIANEAPPAMLLMEVSAGAGKIVGARFEELVTIYERAGAPSCVGFALDTQHMWASGYNWQEGVDPIIESLSQVASLDLIKVIHLNDSKSACKSLVDRHDNLGEGLIGRDSLKSFVRNERIQHIPLVLETPRMKTPEEASLDVAVLREWVA